jgi:cytochrome c
VARLQQPGRALIKRPLLFGGAMKQILAILPLALAGLISAAPARAQDATAGQAVFKKNCAICHTTEPGKNKIGPSLAGVVGRKAGTAPNYTYSEANKKSGVAWDESTLNTYLEAPTKFIPGTKMVFAGLKNPDDRKNVIAFLKTQK